MDAVTEPPAAADAHQISFQTPNATSPGLNTSCPTGTKPKNNAYTVHGMLYTLIHTCTVIHKCSVYIFNRCNGMSSCAVPVTNSVFPDPCRGTYKYLTVSFKCLPASKCDY